MLTLPLRRVLSCVVVFSAFVVRAATAQSDKPLRVTVSGQDRLVLDSAGALMVRGVGGSGAAQNPGNSTMLFWSPRRAALRAGASSGTEWDDNNVGAYSVALGNATHPSGDFSVAMGQGTSATGAWSMAMGDGATASGAHSVALGLGTSATQGSAFAMGEGSAATGEVSAAFGYHDTASGLASNAMGVWNTAAGGSSLAAGGFSETAGDFTIALGFHATAAGSYSVALGSYASTNSKEGSFVFGDRSTDTPLLATAGNQFSVRAASGVRFFTNAAMSLGVSLSADGTSWNTISDRNRKTDFALLDGEDLLARIRQAPVSTWRYIDQQDRSVRHIGPMAQDFRRAFALNADSTTINSSDLSGVTLAGVQALDARTEAQAERITALEAENSALEAANTALRAELIDIREDLHRLHQLGERDRTRKAVEKR